MRALVFGLLVLSVAACRQPRPEEIVYTGRRAAPPGPADASVLVDAGTIDVPFTKAEMLVAVADCTIGRYRELEMLAAVLVTRAEAAAADRSAENVAAARDAWRAAMASLEEVELFRFGPAARTMEPGGLGLRDQIYAWPLGSRCTIEEQIVSRLYASAEFAASRINGRGLGAFEYLVFYEGTDNACSGFSRINAEGTWAALGASELALRKAEYAAAVARDVHARVVALIAAFEGSFRAELVTPGGLFATDHDALNAVSDALFYVDKELKDMKLGRPLGLSECANTVCPEAVESLYAKSSVAHVRANLIGFQRIFRGCGPEGAGIGFDDWLSAAGAGELSARMSSATLVAISTVDGLAVPLEEALVSDPGKVWDVYNAIKAINDPLKAEMVTVLNLELPRAVEGDND